MWVICGAGVVGLTLAIEARKRGIPVTVLEEEPRIALHASGRNSGVLHAGIYYPPGSLKAQLCLEGNRLLRTYIQEKGLPFLATGKVIVASRPEDLPVLERLFRYARANGTPVEWVDETEVQRLIPGARTVERALYSPLTATTAPQIVMEQLYRDLLQMGGRVELGVRCIGPAGEGRLRTSRGVVAFERLINAAGMYADRLAHAFGVGHAYRILPFKGIYFRLHPRHASTLSRNLYPTPDPELPFLGVHFTPAPDGRVWVGPTAIPALGRKHYGILSGLDREALPILLRDALLFWRNPAFRRTALRESRKLFRRWFYEDARRLFPPLRPEDLLPSSKVGLRAQLVDIRNHTLVMDFLILPEKDTLHILNAVSPAFTSSMAFARMVMERYLQT